MATKKTQSENVEAFCLRDSGFGMAGEVISLPVLDAEMGAAQGMLDLHPSAIAAAKEN